ncbi:putative diguanylate cyclase YegE [Phycisphaerae bacterium RAS1]|nr:putative diguanylate cyclase YegE [Phycisphaerae bacterium RAS1]
MAKTDVHLNVVQASDSDWCHELPDSVIEARRLASLDSFLDDAALGFHWSILDSLEDGVYITDLDRRIRYWSRSAERITGFAAEEVLGHSCSDKILRHMNAEGVCLCEAGCPLRAVMGDGRTRSANVFLHHKAGHRVPVHVWGVAIRDLTGTVIGAFETFSDTTETCAAIERVHALENVAFVDALTGVPNRRSFESEFAGRLATLRHGGPAFGLVLCDIDHFKRFNDEHGHDVGDAVLTMVARTLRHACRSGDMMARWGGEEFVILTGDAVGERVRAMAERFRSVVEHSWLDRNGLMLQVTISLGATIAGPEDDQGTLFKRVDELLYASKQAGRNRVTM